MEFNKTYPIGLDRLDTLFASVVAAIYNTRRNVEKFPEPWPISDFILEWGKGKPKKKDDKTKPGLTPARDWRDLKLIGQIYSAAFNMIEEADAKDAKKKKKR